MEFFLTSFTLEHGLLRFCNAVFSLADMLHNVTLYATQTMIKELMACGKDITETSKA